MSSYDLAEIWVKCKDKFKESANEKIFDVWIKPIIPLEVTDNYYKVAVKNSFFKTMLEENYANLIQGILSNIMGKNIQLVIEAMEADAPSMEEALEAHPQKMQQQQLFTEKTVEQPIDESNLNSKFVFETFVIGNSNRFAHAAAQAVANNPAHAYNPLFLYGGVGLGKTHLMHAIGNRIKQNNPSMKVLYTTSEKFTNEIINSIQNKTTEAFRQKYRNIDCLIIDDIQFLKGKEQTQVEFFHTFNALKDANKQIIISSDRPPREIETLEDRLRSRFDQGLTADIQPPDLETRMAILRTTAASDNIQMPNDVITLLATNIATNIMGLGWACTPAGLKAMEHLADLNDHDTRASDAMCGFLVLNISSLQLIPVNMSAYRSKYGSVNPSAVILPAILATMFSTFVGILFIKMKYRKER